MYNANESDRNELPSSAQLLKSTVVALLAASVILVTIVLPAEYGIDPTGIGSVLGLKRMGEIKVQLSEEAAADAPPAIASVVPDVTASATGESVWRDETKLNIAPEEAVELKLVMAMGDKAEFEWDASGGVLNFNAHGDGGGQSIEYAKGRAAPTGEGNLVAAFDGYHGWFWRNRSAETVELTLRTRGTYAEIKRTR